MKHTIIRSREQLSFKSFAFKMFTLNSLRSCCSSSHPSVLGKTLLSLLPALSCGCTAEGLSPSAGTAEHKALIRMSGKITQDDISSLDIFVFKDDDLRILDCYQRVDKAEDWDGNVCSSTGDRIISICANSRIEADEWPWIRSRGSLEKMASSLELERRNAPFMSGEARVTAKESRPISAEVSLRPMISEIYLRSISCDFTGKPYAGEEITDAKVYLTNINAECGMLEDGDIRPRRVINAGRLCKEDLELFEDPGIVCQELGRNIGKLWLKPEIKLWCYPSNAYEASIGTPFSRLVIEGKISGQTYYWPISINREDGNTGIDRNRQYIYDIKITRKGSTDPDIPVEAEDMEIKFKTAIWEEKENCIVGF